MPKSKERAEDTCSLVCRCRLPLSTHTVNHLAYLLRRRLNADGAIHKSYGDDAILIPQAGRILGMTDRQIQDVIGTLPPARTVRIQQAYLLAFFDQHLRHRRGHLLHGPSPALYRWSRAFFSTPGMLWLYSGVTMTNPSYAGMVSAQRRVCSFWY